MQFMELPDALVYIENKSNNGSAVARDTGPN